MIHIHLAYIQIWNIHPQKISSRLGCFCEQVLTQSAKTERHLQDVLKMSYQDKQEILLRHLPHVQKMSQTQIWKTSWRDLSKIYCRCLTEDVLKCLINLSWRCIKVIWCLIEEGVLQKVFYRRQLTDDLSKDVL